MYQWEESWLSLVVGYLGVLMSKVYYQTLDISCSPTCHERVTKLKQIQSLMSLCLASNDRLLQ